MKITPLKIKDVLLIEPKVFEDERGYFFESFNAKTFEETQGFLPNWVQDNESKSSYGVLRGLHFQKPPMTQAKLVRVLKGEVLDVAVDIREGSPTFGEHVAVRISGNDKKQLYIPRGFAHGFAVLSEEAIFSYKCDNFYAPEYDSGIHHADSAFNIDWLIPEVDRIISTKDKNLKELKHHPKYSF